MHLLSPCKEPFTRAGNAFATFATFLLYGLLISPQCHELFARCVAQTCIHLHKQLMMGSGSNPFGAHLQKVNMAYPDLRLHNSY